MAEYQLYGCLQIIVNIHAVLLQIFYQTSKRTIVMKLISIPISIEQLSVSGVQFCFSVSGLMNYYFFCYHIFLFLLIRSYKFLDYVCVFKDGCCCDNS